MIIGIGIDIVNYTEVDLNEKFVNSVLSEDEIIVLSSITLSNKKREYICSRFAGKEALVKAFGRRIDVFKNISILNDVCGKPYVLLKNKFIDIDIYKILISITHTNMLTAAVVVLER